MLVTSPLRLHDSVRYQTNEGQSQPLLRVGSANSHLEYSTGRIHRQSRRPPDGPKLSSKSCCPLPVLLHVQPVGNIAFPPCSHLAATSRSRALSRRARSPSPRTLQKRKAVVSITHDTTVARGSHLHIRAPSLPGESAPTERSKHDNMNSVDLIRRNLVRVTIIIHIGHSSSLFHPVIRGPCLPQSPRLY